MSQSLDFQQLCTSHKTSLSQGLGSLRGLLAAALARSSESAFFLPQAADADLVAGDAMAFGLADSYPCHFQVRIQASSIRDEVTPSDSGSPWLRRRDESPVTPLLVTATLGVMQRVPTPEQLESSTRSLKVGQLIDAEEVRQWLAVGILCGFPVQLPESLQCGVAY